MLVAGDRLTYDQMAQEIMKFEPEFTILRPIDWNGMEMGAIFRFLKRSSSLFSFRYGQARKIETHFWKFLCNRYGILHRYYPTGAEYEVIEKDIEELLAEKFKEAKYDEIVNPTEESFS